jgi:hypothetical protein
MMSRRHFHRRRTNDILAGMTVMQLLMTRSRSAMRKAAVVLAATQIMLGSLPLTESGSRGAAAHIEATGVQLHHAHSEESCIACAALKIFDSATPEDKSALALSKRYGAAGTASDIFDPRLANGRPRSRAPPSQILG